MSGPSPVSRYRRPARAHLVVLAAVLAAVTAGPAGAAGAAPSGVDVSARPARIAAVLGDTVTVTTTVANRGPVASGPLVAHLDVVSLRDDVYVDPEDWSSQRSVDVEPLAPGGRTVLSWPVRTVDAGEFAVYVVLLPTGPGGPAHVTPSAPVHLAVTGKRTLDAGGTLPVVVGMPLLLTLAALVDRWRRRRRVDPRPGPAPGG
jgi:hypothetical protein